MSIKRYEMKTKYRGHESWDELEEDKEGGYVDYEDYSALEQKLTDTAVQLANAESKCRELAAESHTARHAVQVFCDVVGANTDAICEEVGPDGVKAIL
ncbi:hypothetical protein L2W97_22265, partial [Citrobacter freundii]|nr:hypothetical protein [Citrobacter freundii]